MQPKPIDFRRVLDIDFQRRTVEMEGFAEHLRGVREHKENPAETDYDIVHDEQGRRDGEETAKQSAKKLKHSPADEESETEHEHAPEDEQSPPENGKGSNIDIEA